MDMLLYDGLLTAVYCGLNFHTCKFLERREREREISHCFSRSHQLLDQVALKPFLASLGLPRNAEAFHPSAIYSKYQKEEKNINYFSRLTTFSPQHNIPR
jgi:hypothetical protein